MQLIPSVKFLQPAKYLMTLMCLVCFSHVQATRISGKVFSERSIILPFSSILVKGTTTGTTANSEGEFYLDLNPGNYTLICQHVGYEKREREITVGSEPLIFNFVLREERLTLQEIIIKPGGKDPAYEIIRGAIKNRPFYKKQVAAYQCNVYIKGQIRLRKYPKTFFGQTIDLEDGDTSGNKIIYLSETMARYSFSQPDKQKIEVLSTRVSGQSGGFGFSNPQVISFYENKVELTRNLNPRGFISPIADNALQFYTYKYRGAFFEDGKQVNKIEVIPRRKYEPLFNGFINITENDWRIHSIDLNLDKESQMEFIDALNIQQLYVPVSNDTWMLQSQTILPAAKQFGFDAYGYFTTLYSDYIIEARLKKNFFDRAIIKYEVNSNKQKQDYWDSIRPVPLLPEELRDFSRKDSLEKLREDPDYLDSLDRRQNRITPLGFFLNGQTFQRRSKKTSFTYEPFFKSFGFNTVEGWNLRLSGTFQKDLRDRKSIAITPVLRYGFNNGHFNAFITGNYRFGKTFINELSVSGGKRVIQFNNTNPIAQFNNSFNTLFRGYNYMKIYEAWFGNLQYTKGVGEGLTLEVGLQFQSRRPLNNTDTTTFWGKSENKSRLTPNYPTEISQSNISPHEALIGYVTFKYQPGAKYIELPDRKINLGSKYPLFSVTFARGSDNLLGSDVDYDRWRFSVMDNLNFKLAGELRYKIEIGGFFEKSKVELPDYQHFNGNRVLTATPYLNSFQLAPYYERSNTEDFFSILHLEHHFNGALTNKIPFVRRLNLRLVGGTNAFYVNRDNYYYEFFFGIDNVLKIFRFDYVFGYNDQGRFDQGLRIGIKAFSTLFEEN
jgi:hypothetical protein